MFTRLLSFRGQKGRESGLNNVEACAGSEPVLRRFHAPIYCAARNIYRAAAAAPTAADADRLSRALAELLLMAEAVESPSGDRDEIHTWSEQLAETAASMRKLPSPGASLARYAGAADLAPVAGLSVSPAGAATV